MEAQGSGVLGDVVRRTIRDASDLELVTPGEPAAHPEAQLPDVLILAGIDPDDVTWPTPALEHCASVRLLAIGGDRDGGYLFELLPRRLPLGEMTAERLLAAVRRPPPPAFGVQAAKRRPDDAAHRTRRQRTTPPTQPPRRPNAHQED